ncbi:MAG TPA: glycosyltransferase family 4 protein [Pyrinomonadaceae bacterium]|nr:glycosyltransferase family 4 protein [Pyrinomonadaceae bacterium]
MKKILIFSLAYFPKYVGGAEVAIKEITDRITDVEFHLITNRYDSTLPTIEKVGNVLVHRIGFTTQNPSMVDLRKWPLHVNKPLFQFLAAWKALMLHRKYSYDGIWAMMPHSSGVPAAIFKLFHSKVPYILTIQEGDPPEHIERTMLPVWPLFSRAFTSADVVTGISTFLGKWAQRRGFKGEFLLIPNAADTRHFSEKHPDSLVNEIKDELGKKMGDVFLITTSRLVYKNAVDDVIRALPKMPDNVHFIILGVGGDEEKLRTLARECGVADRVRFVGYVLHKDMPKYLQAADIFIRPSRSEGMGASFIEAFAAGLPVIATQEGGLSDIIFDEKRNPDVPITGFAVDKDSPDQIAGAVKEIMEHPEKVRAVVATAKQMAIEKYDWDIIARDMREKVFARVFGTYDAM